MAFDDCLHGTHRLKTGEGGQTILLKKIETHNEVNGFQFSAVEFALIALVIGPFAVYYLSHGRIVAGVIALGIVANVLTVAVLALRSMVEGQKSIGIRRWFDSAGRTEIASRYPDITSQTLILTVATLVPFLVMLVTACEFAIARARRT